ncbi:MAG: hypothetical protein GTN93_31750, partial [Anaerolineae bacterium]|nr:hypothetical protein [Anaerolineae bacterium]
KADQARIDAIEIVLPEGTEFSEDATHADKVREIIKGNVKGARLKVEGKVTGRAKVSDFIADLQDSILLRLEDISDHF